MNKISLIIIILFQFSFSYAQANKQNPQLDKIDILHYDFEINLSDENNIINVLANVKIIFRQDIKEFFLDLKSIDNKYGMSVVFVGSNKYELEYKHENDKLFIYDEWNENDTINFEIRYEGLPVDGLVISKNKYGNRTFFGDNWPNRAYNWLSVVDHPSDKASVDFKIVAPDHYDVVANGQLLVKKNISNNFKYFHFSTGNIPLPTKVMVIGVADFDIKNYGKVDNILVSSMVFHPAPKGGLDDYFPAVDVLKYFIDLIGPYSYTKLANVQSKTRYGGMENAGNIFYYEASVNGRNGVEALVAHEIAHQWYGNSVTEKDWHHIWLSEGFATYLTDLYLENKYGKDRLKERMSKERKKVIRYNSNISKPIIDTTVTDWNKLLNPNSYEKGAWFLHMLRNKIGDKSFFATLRIFYEKYRNGNAITKDFMAIAEKESGQDLQSFFQQWLNTPGYPNLEISWMIDNDLLYIKVKQLKGDFDFKLGLRLFDSINVYNLDYSICVKNEEELFVMPIANEFLNNNFKLIIDPEVILLHSAKVSKLSMVPNEIPMIEAGNLLRKGDLLFQDIDCGPLCEAIEGVTQGINGANFSHVGIVTNIIDSKVEIIEAIGSEVKTTDLKNFLKRSADVNNRPKVVVGRVKNTEIIDKAIINLKKYIGKPYDNEFDVENESYYCSELVYFAFKDMNNKNIFSMMPMTYKSKNTGQFFKSWVDYFNNLNIEIPEGEPGINPGGISKSNEIEILYKYGNPQGW